jgi:hypothetical protein
MKELITILLMWIGESTMYDVDIEHPNIVMMPPQELTEQYQATMMDKTNHIEELWAYYNTTNQTIYLRADFRQYDQWDKSILLHELLHHVQYHNKVQFQCINQMEEEAWPLQKKYLKEFHNIDWNYDMLWYLMISTCRIE